MKKVRYGMIGFGGIAENRIAREGFACDKERFVTLCNAELICVTDRNISRKKAAEVLGLKWLTSDKELCSTPEIDAVVIATNNLSHAPLATMAIDCGKHVIIEKPMATTLKDAKLLSDYAKDKHKSIMINHIMRENVYNQKAKQIVSEGVLGDITDCCFHMEFPYGFTQEERSSWRCCRPEEMGGPVGDVASHCFYMAEYICGSEIVEVACAYYPRVLDIVVENGAYIHFRTRSGVCGSIRTSFCNQRGGEVGVLSNLGYEVYGVHGVLRAYGTMFQYSGDSIDPVPQSLQIQTKQGVEYINAGRVNNIFQGVINKHAQSILDGVVLSGEDGAHNLALLEAAHASAKRNGCIIDLATFMSEDIRC